MTNSWLKVLYVFLLLPPASVFAVDRDWENDDVTSNNKELPHATV
jgi:hypothetical protein